MAVAKAVVRGILIVSLASSTVRAGSMLTLGVAPSDGYSPFVSSSSSTTFEPTWQPSALRLGVFSGETPTPLTPNPAPVSNAPAQTNPEPVTVNAPVAVPSITPAPAVSTPSVTPGAPYDAYINFGSGPYPNSGDLTSGNPQPWYLSPGVARLFGGVPTAAQQSAFDSVVLQRVQQGFNLSGVPVTLTDNPNAPAAHTISVVSQAIDPSVNNAIGITNLNGNGFHFVDNSSGVAKTVDQLEWIVSHNVDHELMIAFGVPEIHDTTGQYLDARTGSWSMMTSPNATFSPDAVTDLLSKNFQDTNEAVLFPAAQLLGSPTVPEPTTWVVWSLIAATGIIARRLRSRLSPVDRP